uniref:Uncharacterized protein n=1 Tax=Rhizophora mucronata TaxID=61149 RepID=A0A2P2PT32_RHIMU
MHSLGFSL